MYRGKCGMYSMWVVGRGYVGAGISCKSLFFGTG